MSSKIWLVCVILLIVSSGFSKDRYSVNMWGIPVASVEFYGTDSTYQDLPARYVYFSSVTTTLTSAFFKVDNHYTIWTDPDNYHILSFQKDTYQPGVVNSISTEMVEGELFYQNTSVKIPEGVFTIFSLLDFIKYHRFDEPYKLIIEREGQIFPSILTPESVRENHVIYQLKIDINFPQKNAPVLEHTDVFTWALFKNGVSRKIEVNYNSHKIEKCVFTNGMFRLSAILDG